MTILLQVKTCEIELVIGLDLLWQEGSLRWIRNNESHLALHAMTRDACLQEKSTQSELADAAIAYGNRLVQEVLRINGCFLFINNSAIIIRKTTFTCCLEVANNLRFTRLWHQQSSSCHPHPPY